MTSSEDLYVILQVRRTASVDEIKRAFRKLARRYHPDINPGDRHAEDRFKRITEAYDILSDPLKREFYDVNGFYTDGVLEHRGAGSNWGFQFEGFDFSRSHEGDFREIFENMFARQNRQTPERAWIWSIRSRSALTNRSAGSGPTSPSRECIDARYARELAVRPVRERQHARCAAVPVRRLE